MSEKRALIMGCGYVGLTLARTLVEQGVVVTATTRHADRVAAIEAAGARAVIADAMDPRSLRPLVEGRAHVVFDLVRPQPIGEDRYTVWGTANLASAFQGVPLEAYVYLSSTSVYGRRSGEWTDEDTPARPSAPIGRARVEAERLLLEVHRSESLPVRVCRAPGIYGPGRTLRARLETGAYCRVDDEELWASRVHVDDLANGLVAAWVCGRPGRVYLICDDQPVTAKEYAELTASLLALPLPPTVGREDIRQDLTQSSFERRISARRCVNRRMHEELRVSLLYPSVREGIPAALRAEGAI